MDGWMTRVCVQELWLLAEHCEAAWMTFSPGLSVLQNTKQNKQRMIPWTHSNLTFARNQKNNLARQPGLVPVGRVQRGSTCSLL